MTNNSNLEELADIIEAMKRILSRFRRTSEGIWIADGDEAKFHSLVLDAKDIFSSELGPANGYGPRLAILADQGRANFYDSQSYSSVEEAIGIVESAQRAVRRRANKPSPNSIAQPTIAPYVELSRIAQLGAISTAEWDLRKLVRLCEEINSSFGSENYYATAMILRAIVDHIPPIFGFDGFRVYANSLPNNSFKKSMLHLEGSLRHIADATLHTHARAKEVLPNATQVDFRQSLDVLLSEIVRTLS